MKIPSSISGSSSPSSAAIVDTPPLGTTAKRAPRPKGMMGVTSNTMALSCASLGIGLRQDVLLRGSALMVGRTIANGPGACCRTGQWIAGPQGFPGRSVHLLWCSQAVKHCLASNLQGGL
eukprot:651129-Amphidinium_carterae.2